MKPSELRKLRREITSLFARSDELDRKQSRDIKALKGQVSKLTKSVDELTRAMVELEAPEVLPKDSVKKAPAKKALAKEAKAKKKSSAKKSKKSK